MSDETSGKTEAQRAYVRIIQEAGEAFSQTLSEINYRIGNSSWPREIALAQQKIDEAVMWAIKAVIR